MDATHTTPAGTPAEYIGLDLHLRESQLCILTADGAVAERRVRTTAAWFAHALGERLRTRVLLESSTESEWVARCVEALGHEVVVADPTFAPMYATRARQVKTDRRDARALADACRAGTFRPAHRPSETRRHLRAELVIRDALIRTRTRYVNVARAMTRHARLRLPSGGADRLVARLAALAMAEELRAELAPLVAVLEPLQHEIDTADERLSVLAAADPVIRRLMTTPGVGPVTAAAFVAALDDVARFATAHHVEAYLGLVPREWRSGERQRRGAITKAGSPRVRSLLVEAAWCITRSKRPDLEMLRTWAARIAQQRGRRVALVALARRLAGILYALWRDETEFGARRPRRAAEAA
jgi:transposase